MNCLFKQVKKVKLSIMLPCNERTISLFWSFHALEQTNSIKEMDNLILATMHVDILNIRSKNLEQEIL